MGENQIFILCVWETQSDGAQKWPKQAAFTF